MKLLLTYACMHTMFDCSLRYAEKYVVTCRGDIALDAFHCWCTNISYFTSNLLIKQLKYLKIFVFPIDSF